MYVNLNKLSNKIHHGLKLIMVRFTNEIPEMFSLSYIKPTSLISLVFTTQVHHKVQLQEIMSIHEYYHININ